MLCSGTKHSSDESTQEVGKMLAAHVFPNTSLVL